MIENEEVKAPSMSYSETGRKTVNKSDREEQPWIKISSSLPPSSSISITMKQELCVSKAKLSRENKGQRSNATENAHKIKTKNWP